MTAIQSVRGKLGTTYEYRRVEVVGPTVGKELLHAGILATILAATGSVVLAQQDPKAGVPVAGGAPAIAAVSPAAGSFQTNDIGHLDIAKLQAIFAELGSINTELRPQEQNIQLNDVDLKVLLEKKYEAQQAVLELDNQRRELIDRKLSADPKFATLVARRLELQQTLKTLRSAMSPKTTARENQGGFGPGKTPP